MCGLDRAPVHRLCGRRDNRLRAGDGCGGLAIAVEVQRRARNTQPSPGDRPYRRLPVTARHTARWVAELVRCSAGEHRTRLADLSRHVNSEHLPSTDQVGAPLRFGRTDVTRFDLRYFSYSTVGLRS